MKAGEAGAEVEAEAEVEAADRDKTKPASATVSHQGEEGKAGEEVRGQRGSYVAGHKKLTCKP